MHKIKYLVIPKKIINNIIKESDRYRIKILLNEYSNLSKKCNSKGRHIRRKLRRLGYRLSDQ